MTLHATDWARLALWVVRVDVDLVHVAETALPPTLLICSPRRGLA